MSQQPLFPEMKTRPAEPPLRDPVEATVKLQRDNAKEDAVLIEIVGGATHWIPRRHIRFDGIGVQRVKIEKFKAREIGLI